MMSKPKWQALLKSALDDQEPVLSCHECYTMMDQYADMLMDGVDPAEVMGLVKQHLDECPGCDEVFETLLTMIQGTAVDNS